ncbi:beta-xylosidase [Paenibacillus psychroresistens]|uniref:Beta-xylosidase n=1 Tax=Paenibacillus psychroresistens TaxID=1778678 RepID=A0A6B8RJ48_9BACL|nr:family 43 glycosylhydrolase [Paenibacillus psychroresistens]QGQ96069.1 beta-xylosidase [Paenibacillus psychroresistens]
MIKTINKNFLTKCFTLMLTLAFIFNATPVSASSQVIQNDVFWKDTAGNNIYSQGGGILKVGSTYYWYGVKYNGAVTYANNPTSKNSDTSFNAITLYSSTDLAHWTFVGNVITAGATGTTFDPTSWVGRMGVVYNSTTNKYVLITQYGGPSGSGVLFATSSSPTGTFTYDHVQAQITNVVTPGTGDQTIFIDDDGKPYLIFSNSSGRSHLYVAPLRSSDYLNIEPATNIFNSSLGGREGNAMFKYNGYYYFCSSDLHGWNASQAYYIKATNILGPYSTEAVIGGTAKDFSHVSQTGFFIPVQGSSGTTILFAGDRWSDFAGNGIGYNQWVPLSFSGTTPSLQSLSQYNLDAATGVWSVGAGNNYVLNPSFEADRVVQDSLAGWTNWTNLIGVSPNKNVTGGHTGRFTMTQSYTTAYNASMYQNITVPNGTYTLKAWVKSSGGQTTAQLYVKNYGGTEKVAAINTAMSSWTQMTISNIVVTNGSVQLGVFSVANANNWVRVDDFTLIKN